MATTPRYLTVCAHRRRHPQFFIHGLYLKDFGFEIGAQIRLTNTQQGVLVVEQTKSRSQHQGERRRKYLLSELASLQQKLGPDLPDKQQAIQAIEHELGALDNAA